MATPRRRPRGSAPARRGGRGAPAPARRGHSPLAGRRLLAGLVVSVLLVGFLLVAVFPTRTWLAQREERQQKQEELAAIRAEREEYEERIEELQTPEEVERIAREEYGMTREGEVPYRVLPPAVAPVDLPDTWPFAGAEDWLNR